MALECEILQLMPPFGIRPVSTCFFFFRWKKRKNSLSARRFVWTMIDKKKLFHALFGLKSSPFSLSLSLSLSFSLSLSLSFSLSLSLSFSLSLSLSPFIMGRFLR